MCAKHVDIVLIFWIFSFAFLNVTRMVILAKKM
jgi:hypothetical protein